MYASLNVTQMIGGMIAIIVGLSGCGTLCPSKKTDLESAVDYPHTIDDRYALPLDAWTRNRQVESFFRRNIQSGGVTYLTIQYGLQCTPLSSAVGCADCYVCNGKVHLGAQYIGIVSRCLDYGEVLIHAEVGPGSIVSAMTYWKTTPEVHERLSRIK